MNTVLYGIGIESVTDCQVTVDRTDDTEYHLTRSYRKGNMRIKTEERRNAILQVATEMFLNQGYAMTSMAKIAAAIGGSKGTLYNYFSCKEEMFAAIVSQAGQDHGSQLFKMPDTSQDTRTLLISIGRTYLNFMSSSPILQISRLVIAESARFPELGQIFFENGPKVGIARLSGLFQRLMEEDRIRSGDSITAALHFKGLCDASIVLLRLWNVTETSWPDNIEAVAAAAAETFLNGYRCIGDHAARVRDAS